MSRSQPTILHPHPLNYVYGAIQRYCVGACCGERAFDVSAWWLLNGVETEGREWFTVLDQLDTVFETIAAHKGRRIWDGEMGWNRKTDCGAFYRRIQTEVLRALVHEMGLDVFDPAWLLPNNRAVELMARAIRKKGSFGDAAVLADAMEEAGCVTEELLSRCRNTPPNARANWIVDLLLAGADGILAKPIEPSPDQPV